jgi:2-dehydro-3-deoxygluconokinase
MPDAPPRFDATSFGETMLRLSVPEGRRLEDTRHLDMGIGGAESNVCAALAGLGRRVGWLSRLPVNPLGRHVLRQMRAAGIDTEAVILAPGTRLGTYYIEFAKQPRAIQVTYDRAQSAASQLKSHEVDWEYLLNTRVLHLTGITPALSEGCLELVREAMRRAKDKGVRVSFDVNYRTRLWSAQEAADTLSELLPEVDILICGMKDARALFGLDGSPEQMLTSLVARFGVARTVLTLGSDGALAHDDGRLLQQPSIPATIIDRIGAGDAFAAGLLDGCLDASLEEGLRRGVGLASLAVSQHGDMVIASRDELEELLNSQSNAIAR